VEVNGLLSGKVGEVSEGIERMWNFSRLEKRAGMSCRSYELLEVVNEGYQWLD
jgi:hypothetical protein